MMIWGRHAAVGRPADLVALGLIIVDVANDFASGLPAVTGGARPAPSRLPGRRGGLPSRRGNQGPTSTSVTTSGTPDYSRRGHRIASAVLLARDFHPSLDTSAIEAVFYKRCLHWSVQWLRRSRRERARLLLNWRNAASMRSMWSVLPPIIVCARRPRTRYVRFGHQVLVDLTADVADNTVAALRRCTASVELVCSS